MTTTTTATTTRHAHEARAAAQQSAVHHFENGLQFSGEDAPLGLRYLLLRLSILGLTPEDQTELRALARLTVQGADVDPLVTRLTARETASPLAVAIAHLVDRARADRATALFGAVLGAYAALDTRRGGQPATNPEVEQFVQAASAGAVAACMVARLRQDHDPTRWQQLVDKD